MFAFVVMIALQFQGPLQQRCGLPPVLFQRGERGRVSEKSAVFPLVMSSYSDVAGTPTGEGTVRRPPHHRARSCTSGGRCAPATVVFSPRQPSGCAFCDGSL